MEGIERKLDNLGRIVIPKQIRKKMRLKEGDKLKIYTKGNKVFLYKEIKSCDFCNNTKDLFEFENKKICKNCLQNMSKNVEKVLT